jgi:hypothetical protein
VSLQVGGTCQPDERVIGANEVVTQAREMVQIGVELSGISSLCLPAISAKWKNHPAPTPAWSAGSKSFA